MGTGDTLQRTDIPHLPWLIFMDFVEKWLNSLDWSARPTITHYKNSILQSIKEAKNDNDLMNIIRKVFFLGYEQSFKDIIKEHKNGYNTKING